MIDLNKRRIKFTFLKTSVLHYVSLIKLNLYYIYLKNNLSTIYSN